MYNRYLNQEDFQPVEPEPERPPSSSGQQRKGPLSDLLARLGGKKNAGGLSGIFSGLKLDELDKGDILLILILLYLFWESEDDELLIILGLLLFTGF